MVSEVNEDFYSVIEIGQDLFEDLHRNLIL